MDMLSRIVIIWIFHKFSRGIFSNDLSPLPSSWHHQSSATVICVCAFENFKTLMWFWSCSNGSPLLLACWRANISQQRHGSLFNAKEFKYCISISRTNSILYAFIPLTYLKTVFSNFKISSTLLWNVFYQSDKGKFC